MQTKEQLQAAIAELERQEHELFLAENKKKEIQIANEVTFSVVIQPNTGSFATLWETEEVFECRIIPSRNTDPITHGSGSSIGYLVSRKHKRIIGSTGGGYVWIKRPSDTAWDEYKGSEAYEIIKEKAVKAMENFLASL